jgi:hypothetical protein
MSDRYATRTAAEISDDSATVVGERVDREQDLYDGIEYKVRTYVSRSLIQDGAGDLCG